MLFDVKEQDSESGISIINMHDEVHSFAFNKRVEPEEFQKEHEEELKFKINFVFSTLR